MQLIRTTVSVRQKKRKKTARNVAVTRKLNKDNQEKEDGEKEADRYTNVVLSQW